MMGCSRTAEVQELLRLGHWPQAAGAEFVEHVRGCRRCSEMVLRDGGSGCGEGERR